MIRRFALAWPCLLALAAAQLVFAFSQEQDTEAARLRASLDRAAALYRDKKLVEFRAAVVEVRDGLTALAATGSADETLSLVAPIERRLAAAERLAARLDATLATAPTSTGQPSGGVSFTRQIAPILSGRCANCHIRQARGMFSMATFAALEKGSEAGRVYVPGQGEGSRLVEVLATGDMPRGGAALSDAEVNLIRRWIDEGAKFDGANRDAPLASATASPTQPSAPTLVRARGDEKVLFTRDIAPTLVNVCGRCHAGVDPAQRLDLDTFNGLVRGGQTGPAFVAGKPADSLLIQKLRGTAKEGARMPRGGPYLDEATIARFEAWIADGAKFDGGDPSESLETALRVAAAKKMPHEELARARLELAKDNWRKSDPDSTPIVVESDDFILVGDVPRGVVDEVMAAATAARGKVLAALSLPKDEKLVKGRATLFLFDRRYNYAEFTRMVERRELREGVSGHFHFDIIDAYGCLMIDDMTQKTPALLAEQMAGLATASRGESPTWFQVGTGRAVAAAIEPRSSLVRSWTDAVRASVRGMDVDAFLAAEYPDPAAALGVVNGLRGDMTRFRRLWRQTADGENFARSLSGIYGKDAKSLINGWLGLTPPPGKNKKKTK